MGMIMRLLRRGRNEPDGVVAAVHAPLQMQWRDDVSMPIADWRALQRGMADDASNETRHAYWSQAAQQWLEALGAHLGTPYAIQRSDNFLLLSPLIVRTAQLTLQACERMRHRILRTLPGIAKGSDYGPHVVLIFDTKDAYYDYIDNYYPEPGEYAQSSGMFIQHGYGHFVFTMDHLVTMDPIIAHELTHCLVAHLQLPAWLNEGLAVGVEKKLHPPYLDPRNASRALREMTAKHEAFWNPETIQSFWSGKAFLRPDGGSELSYDLGEHLTRLLSRDYAAFTAFANAATTTDSGMQAAQQCLGIELDAGVVAILGDGDWRPRPEDWRAGIERGQFSPPGGSSEEPQDLSSFERFRLKNHSFLFAGSVSSGVGP